MADAHPHDGFGAETGDRLAIEQDLALRGLGETRWPMFANFAGYWLFGLPLGLTLCFIFHWGIYGLWIGLTVALIVIALALLLRWRRDSARLASLA